MLQSGDRVVAGISGGADSVCLLFVLLEWAKNNPLELAVVHVNHGVRREGWKDAAYVEELCRAQGIPFYLVQEDVPARAALEKASEEETGRKVRYEAFARVAEELQANKIAVAHNSNDRSETMLFHLFRGSGIKGLSSIRPIRDEIIRPILCLERCEIEEYLQKKGIPYCQDVTNSTDDYTRNRIRHHILPFVEGQIVQGCVQHMAQTAEMLSETEDYLEQQTMEAMQNCVERLISVQDAKETIRYQIAINIFLTYHAVIQKRILHALIKALSPHQKDISYVNIRDVQELFFRSGNRMICLPFGIRAKREYEKVLIELEQNRTQDYAPKHIFRDIDKSVITQEGSHRIPLGEHSYLIFSIYQTENIFKDVEKVPSNQCTKWFDYDKIKGCITLRTRKTGDYLTITRSEGQIAHKSLKDYMIAQKIPGVERDRMLLLAEDNHVLWLLGHRISEYYKITENTKCILQVQLINEGFIGSRAEEKSGRTC